MHFLAVAALAGYFHTVTGFGLGIIVMGATSGLGMLSVASVAAVISLMMLVNCLVALPGRLKYVHWRSVCAAGLGIVPAILLGVLLLDYLEEGATAWLRVMLGLVIIYCGVSLFLEPSRRQGLSSPRSFALFGGASGFLGGLFGIAGPPLIYHCYRQPIELVRISSMLIVLFSLTSAVRTLFIAVQGQLNADILLLTAWSIPVIAVSTFVGRRFPPPIPMKLLRQGIVLFLVVVGLRLIFSAG
nr:sulfite exporter TauE/SafE family protein [Halomonas aerodenitrificans]